MMQGQSATEELAGGQDFGWDDNRDFMMVQLSERHEFDERRVAGSWDSEVAILGLAKQLLIISIKLYTCIMYLLK